LFRKLQEQFSKYLPRVRPPKRATSNDASKKKSEKQRKKPIKRLFFRFRPGPGRPEMTSKKNRGPSFLAFARALVFNEARRTTLFFPLVSSGLSVRICGHL